jgi:hypothetical protein
LHDEHLQQALRHAPDQELTPNDATRNAVLAYASKVIKPRHATWLGRLAGVLHNWHVSNWQLASMGSVVATLLAVVVFWHGQPEETIWVASVPTEISTAESSESAADAVPGKQISDKKIAEVAIPQEYPKHAGEDKAWSVLPAAPTASTVVAGVGVDAGAENVGQLKQKSEVPSSVEPSIAETGKFAAASAPEAIVTPGINAAPVSKGNIVMDRVAESGVAKEQVARKSVPVAMARTESKNNPAPSIAVGTAVGTTLGAAAPAEVYQGDGNSALASAISKGGGRAIANRDISTGVLRNLYLAKHFVAKTPLECGQLRPDGMPLVDDITGYRIEIISGCYSTEHLIKEVDNYNQAMREWHARGGR